VNIWKLLTIKKKQCEDGGIQMKVGILMGGISSEREISLKSGEAVFNAIDKSKYEPVAIVIDSKEDIINKVKGIDFAFLALHGQFGEDGTVQSVLQTLNIPYSGCGPMTSAICMDKDMTKKVLKSQGINTARWTTVRAIQDIDYALLDSIGYPFFVKPNSGGSSVATNRVDKKEQVEAAVVEALKYDTEVMIEEYVKGDEITCSIINRKTYPIVAIKPTGEFFDFTSKYQDNGAEEIVVQLEENLSKTVEAMAIACWDALKFSAYVRVDMIIKNNVPYVLELNTLPGMTKNSLLPKSVAGAGISYTDLISLIIEESLKVKR